MASSGESYTQLLSLAVHEFRTPASVVGGYLRMLQGDTSTPLSQRQRRMIDEAERSCQRLVALIGELSEIQKLDANLIQLTEQAFDAFPAMAEAAQGVQELEDRDVRLVVRGEATGAPMRGDVTRLRKAFAAIFHASMREMPAGTTVIAERRIEKVDGQSSAILIVADEPNVQTSYEAEPFPFDEKRGGVGLSLPIARRIIERHHGRIWSAAGSRAVAIISLPCGVEY
jgi:two-component system sensor histidine kinase KdpD